MWQILKEILNPFSGLSTGWGWIVVALLILLGALVEVLSEYLSGDEQFYQSRPGLFCSVLFVSGLVINWFNTWIGQVPSKPDLQFQMQRRSPHSFFFIPLRYWGWILMGISAVVFICFYLLRPLFLPQG